MAISADYDYASDLNRLKEAQKNAAVADLENTRNQALSNLQAESQKNAATYNAQRSSANAQNRLSAKNFQEYLANTGRANSGLSAQAKMQGANNLQTSINTLNAGEAAANADINRRTTDTHNAYSSGLASANANIESQYIQNLMNERQKAFEREQTELNRQLQERQFNESVRQFNEQMALQRQQMYSNFRSGRSNSKSGRSSDDDLYTDTPVTGTANNVPVKSIAGLGLSIKDAAKLVSDTANKAAQKTSTKTTQKTTNSKAYNNVLKEANKSGLTLTYKK